MATFRPLEHVRKRVDFERAYDTGAKVSGRYMTMFVAPNTAGVARLGVAATRKIGGAVVRNRAKRLSRELFRHQKPSAALTRKSRPRAIRGKVTIRKLRIVRFVSVEAPDESRRACIATA